MLDREVSMLTLSSTKRQRHLVFSLAFLSVCIFVIAYMFSGVQLPVVEPFLPAYIALTSFIELVTAYVLWNHYKEFYKLPLFILTLTYFFSSLVVIPHIVTFPGVFHDDGLLGAGSQTAVYLWSFWHGVYPIGFILYFISRYQRPFVLSVRVRTMLISGGFLVVTSVIVGFLILTTRFHDVLPSVIEDGNYSGLFSSSIGPVIIAVNVTAVCLAVWKKNKSVMDLLVLLTTLTFCLDVFLTLSAAARYTVGWYAARVISLFSASVVLLAFVREMTQLNRKMIHAHHTLESQFLRIIRQKEQIERSEERYRLVVNSIHEVIFQMNAKGLIVYVNQYWRALFGKDVPSDPFSLQEFIHQDDQKLFDEYLYTILSLKEGYQEKELRFKAFDGTVIWLGVSVIPLEEEGVVTGAYGTLRELSAQMKEREMEKYRVLGQLTTAICHEIRNPLTAVRGFVQLLERNHGAENKHYIPVILNELDKAENSLVDYLQFSRPTIDTYDFISFHEVMNHCISVVQAFALSQNIFMTERIEQHIILKADRGKLEKIIVNIMMNGIEAMQNGGELRITAVKKRGVLQVVIQDFGTGMSGDEMKRVGEPSYSLKNKGTGFGMMIAKQYVLAMNGDISLESRKGYGTKVTVTFPLVDHAMEEASASIQS